jgi:cellulose biosynthesis protein BcsQ
MAFFLAVANRKGGVGKSTVAVMMAQAAAVWGGKRVLMIDLDSQCNASLILLGGQGWSEARLKAITIADYFYDLFDGNNPQPRDYLLHNVGDVREDGGKPARISLLTGSLLLEDVQGELFIKQSRHSSDPETVGNRVRGRIEQLLRRFAQSFDLVIFDCAPGLSLAALAALKTADLVLVPFKPDYVSQLAVDRVALLIEEKRTIADLDAIPEAKRRYVCLANAVRDASKDRVLIEEIALAHPVLRTMLPQRDAIANAFDYEGRPVTMAGKYAEAARDARMLYDELAPRLVTLAAAAE